MNLSIPLDHIPTAPIPPPSLSRLPRYHRYLIQLMTLGIHRVSCSAIGRDLNLVPVQVRKDLQYTGIVGKPKTGYSVPALIQAIARLELEQGFAWPALVTAQEALAENRFIAARDGTAAELIDPAHGSRIPLARLLDDVLAAARPHAAALDALDELEDVRTLILAPEPSRQERLRASAGLPVLIADLAARFAA